MKYIYIVILSVVFHSCNDKNNQPKETTNSNSETHFHVDVSSAQFESENMELGHLKAQNFFETVTTTGYIDVPPQNKASISSFMDGYVTNTPLLVGDEVKKGQLVVTLQNPEYVELQQNYLEVSETLNYLKSEYERQKTLFKENITSKKNYLKAESEYKSNIAHYNGLKQKLRMLNLNPKRVEQGKISSTISLFAPINGFVTKVNVSNGSYVDASSEIVEIVDTDHIHLELSVFEKDILNIKKGQAIKFKISEASNETFDAEVYLVGTSIDETKRTIEIHGHLHDDTHQKTFVRGMFVEADIIISTNKIEALPKEAIAEIDGAYYALILNSNHEGNYEFERTKVKIGKRNEEFTEILNIDDFKDKKVLTKGAYMLLADNEGGGHSH
jgi:cobalt-zinc-cadmium efflux system membrane fusion protein